MKGEGHFDVMPVTRPLQESGTKKNSQQLEVGICKRAEHAVQIICTDDEDACAGSDACDHIGGYTLPLSMVLLAEGEKL